MSRASEPKSGALSEATGIMTNLNKFMDNTIKFSVDEKSNGKRLDVFKGKY